MGKTALEAAAVRYTLFMDMVSTKALLEEIRCRRLGYGKAAELAGITLAEFLTLMGKHRITPFDYDAEELAREIGAGSHPRS